MHLGVNFKTILSLTRPLSNAYTNHKLSGVSSLVYMPEAIKFQLGSIYPSIITNDSNKRTESFPNSESLIANI
jgi:hypothetical protein